MNQAQQPSVAARVRYRFDSALSGGPTTVILWLGAITFALIIAAAAVIAALGLGIDNGQSASFLESFWQSMLRVLDSGTFAGDNGWGLRVVALLVTLGGIIIASSLIGLVATAFDQQIEKLRKGRSAVIEDDHTLVLGWSPRLFTILSELVIANENQKRPAIVLLAAVDKTQMEDDVRARVGDTKNTRIVCRTGDPTNPDDLALVNIGGARSIIVLAGEESDGDADAVKAVLAVMAGDPGFERAHVVAEMRDARYARTLRQAAGHRVLTVRADDVIARVTAQACHQVGLSKVYRELLDFDGDELYLESIPELVGHTFGESVLAFESSSLIGLARADGKIVLNPPADTVLTADDKVIAISADDDTVVFSGWSDVAAPAVALVAHPAPAPQHILLVGWSTLGPLVLAELDGYLPAGTKIDVLYDPTLVSEDPFADMSLEHAQLEPHVTEDEAGRLHDMDPRHAYDQVIVLGYREALSAAEADARTLLSLLTVRRLWPPSNDPRPRVVAEVLDSRNVSIAQATGVDDFVVSDELSSLMIAQLAERPELLQVFDELFDAEGSSIGVRPAAWYVPAEPLPFSSVVAAARARGEVALGYRLDDATVVLNPPKSATFTFGAKDRIVVIGTFY